MKKKATLLTVKNKSLQQEFQINTDDILYAMKTEEESHAKPWIYMIDGKQFSYPNSMGTLEEELGKEFIRISRQCIVASKAIHSVTKEYILLNTGEKLSYSNRNRKRIICTQHENQKKILKKLHESKKAMTYEDYAEHYRSFDHMPFAFADIEMVFDDNAEAVDWIFCYGNDALAQIEKTPLKDMIGNSFGSVFANMDTKWLRSYEQVVLYGIIQEIIDYSPEIDTYLHVTCFPTFPGHCGCILKDITKIEYAEGEKSSEKALRLYLAKVINA